MAWKWRRAYRTQYVCTKDDHPDVDEATLESLACKTIKDDILKGKVDVTLVKDCEQYIDEDDALDEDIDVPKLPIWYQNAVIAELWRTASPSQRLGVENYEEEEDEEEDTETMDGAEQARLRNILR